MLLLVSKAIIELLYPFTWNGVFIPVLPARLIQALEAPCPYIVGIERRYENVELPSDDFVLVDLDQNEIESTAPPIPMPKQQRRKLTSLLQLAAPHHNRHGVPTGAPATAIETFPWDALSSENTQLFNGNPPPTSLAKYAGLNSTSFGNNESGFAPKPLVFNAFLQGKDLKTPERPPTTSTMKESPPTSLSPTSTHFPPTTPISRSDSGFALQTTLREKRSGHFDSFSRRSSSFGADRRPTLRRPSAPFGPPGHASNPSISTISTDGHGSAYAPSVMAPSTYAQSTLAASTIMPQVLYQPVKNSDTVCWVEGHCLHWRAHENHASCLVCGEKAEDGIYRCNGCNMHAHPRCAQHIGLVCPIAFHPDQIRAAFVRCFASLLYTYRKFLAPATGEGKKAGLIYQFNTVGFTKSLPRENAEYVAMLQQTQGKKPCSASNWLADLCSSGFNEFIHERESKPANDPTIALFDQIILAKRNRGRQSIFGKSKTTFLSDTSDHLWRSAAANPPNGRFPGDYRSVITRSKIHPRRRFGRGDGNGDAN